MLRITGRCARLPAEEGKEDKLIVIGDKGRAQLTRTHAKEIEEIIQDVGKVRITFAQACGLCSPALHVCVWVLLSGAFRKTRGWQLWSTESVL